MNERTIYLSALDITDPAERSAYLDRACAGNAKLRQQVDALLVANDRSGEFLDVPALRQMTDNPDVTQTFGEKSDDEEEFDLSYLTPSAKPGSLGTLGHYEVMQVLGQGGFGTVLKAFDEKLHRMVAIKVLSRQLAATSPPRKRFLREARAVAAIKHENVVQVYSVEEQPLPYIVMEFVNGSTLQDKMDEAGPLGVPEVLHLGRQIAAGLAAAHSLGLIHRDIKPANILLEKGVVQKVKITDFGLARTADDASLTQSGTIAGTPLYMAPEQAKAVKLDSRADLFSLGSVLYALTCGHPPFRAPTTLAVLRRVAEDTPRPLQDIIPETPDWFVAIVDRLLAKDPNDRFQTAQEVTDLLTLCQSNLHAGVTPTAVNLGLKPAPVEPVAKAESKRNKFPFAGVAAGVLLMFTVMAVGLFFLNKFKNDGTVAVVPPATPAVTPAVTPTDPLVEAAPTTFKNSIGMDFVKVPKGTGWLGGGAGKPGEAKVVIEQDFYLGKYEVTQEEWEAVTGLNPSYFSRTGTGKVAVKAVPDAELKRFPVENVSWDDCQVFIERLNKKEKETGWVYRLPTEAEWEYACRGGPVDKVDSAWHFYLDKPTNALRDRQGNCVSEGGKDWGRTTTVGTYTPNRLGLHDMHGNVWEWCGDREVLYGDAIRHRHRGGCWGFSSDFCQASCRGVSAYPPSHHHDRLGLRLARVPVATAVYSGGKILAVPPIDPAWVKMVQALPAVGQFNEVMAELKRLNPGCSAPREVKTDRITVWKLLLENDSIRNLSPLQALVGLKHLELKSSTAYGERALLLKSSELIDLAPLAGLKQLKHLQVMDCPALSDLSALKGLELEELGISRTGITDLSPVKLMPLHTLYANDTPIKSLEPLRNKPLRRIQLVRSLNLDFDPIRTAPLEEVILDLDVVRSEIKWLKSIPTLKTINSRPAAAIWKELDTPSHTNPDRKAAELVLSLGGEVVINNDFKLVKDAAKLPKEPFQLKSIDLKVTEWWNEPMKFNDTDMAKLKDCNHLESVNLNGTQVTDAGLENLKACKDLQILCLLNTKVSDAGLAYFKDNKNFSHIHLDSTQITDAGVAHLKDNKNMSQLILNKTQVSDEGLAHFKNCKKLALLNLSNTKVSDAGLLHFKGCDDLHQLVLDATEVTDVGLAQFLNCKKLVILGLKKTKVTAKCIDEFKKALPKCRIESDFGVFEPMAADTDRKAAEYVLSIGGEVRLHGVKREIQALADLPPEPFELAAVMLSGNKQVTDAGLAVCSSCKKLTHLDLVKTKITDAGVAHFAGNKDLVVLNLAHTSVSDEGLAHFQGNTNLTELWLGVMPNVTDRGMAYFKDCKKLTRLWLGGNYLTDKGVAHFKGCKNLLDLSVMNTSVTDEGLARFQECKQLKYLWLHGVKLTDKGLALFKECQDLTEVYLDKTSFSNSWLTHLKNSKNLNTLSLTKTSVGDDVLPLLKEFKGLKFLYLQDTEVTASGIEGLKKSHPDCKIEWNKGVIEPTTKKAP